MPWVIVLGLAAISFMIPALFGGGWLWLLTAVALPLIAGWIVLQTQMDRSDRRPEAAMSTKHLPVGIVLSTGVAVAIFCAVVAFAFQH